MTVGIVQVLSAAPAKNSTAHDTSKSDGSTDFAEVVDGDDNPNGETASLGFSSQDEQPKNPGTPEGDAVAGPPQQTEDTAIALAASQDSVELNDDLIFDSDLEPKQSDVEPILVQRSKTATTGAPLVEGIDPTGRDAPDTKHADRVSSAAQHIINQSNQTSAINPSNAGAAQATVVAASSPSIDTPAQETLANSAGSSSPIKSLETETLRQTSAVTGANEGFEKHPLMSDLKPTGQAAAAVQTNANVTPDNALSEQELMNATPASSWASSDEAKVLSNVQNSNVQNPLGAALTDTSKATLPRTLQKADLEFEDRRGDRSDRVLDRNVAGQSASIETAAQIRDNTSASENLIKQAYFHSDKSAASVAPDVASADAREFPDKVELTRLDGPTRSLESSTTAVSNTAFSNQQAKSDQVRQIMVQIFQGTTPKDGETIQVRLTPEELGTVTYRLSTSETGAVIHVTSDRAETLDLLRRNTDQLLAEFAGFGFSDADVTFSEDTSSEPQTKTGNADADGLVPEPALGPAPSIAYKINAASGVDIRI